MTPYDTDVYAWSQEQAALLDGKQWDALDITNLIEEILSVGASQYTAVRHLSGGLSLDGCAGAGCGLLARGHTMKVMAAPQKRRRRQPAGCQRPGLYTQKTLEEL